MSGSLLRAMLLAAPVTCTLLASCAKEAAPQAPTTHPIAELALRNGAVYTVDDSRSWAQAVAIRDGRIVYVGTDEGLKAHVGPETQVVDLGGRMLMPGFQDSHIHPIGAGVEANACDLNGLETVDEYISAIKKYAETHPQEPWITGGGWLMSAFGPGALARRELLDAVVPDRPVFLASSDGHSSWVNTKALELAGINNETPDPPDGRIDRDPKTGAAIGSLQEGAGALVSKVMPATTDAQRDAGLRYSIKLLNGLGITALQDASVGENELKTYKALDGSGGLSMHVVASIWWKREEGLEQIENIKRLREEYTGGHIDAGTVKIMQDGVMENYTAVVLDPYLKKPGNVRGIPMVDPERLKAAVAQLDSDGFQVHFHAIGDGAVRQVLDAVQAAREKNGALGHRHHISHLELIHPTDVPRFRELGVIANFQPLWAFADEYITDLTMPFVGPERTARLYPIGTMYRSGAVVAFGSDWSVSSANPFEEIEVAVTRMGPAGETEKPFLPDERIGLPEALAAFTINAAYTNRMEKDTGSIEVGKSADLIVLDQNLFGVPSEKISETKPLVTLFEGKAVHGDLGSL
jgi:predicted amidohydrolase YtcJ